MEKLLKEYKLFLGMQYRKKNTIESYYNSAYDYIDYVSDITREETQRYIAYLNQNRRPNGVTTRIVGLNRFFEYINRKDLRVRTPSWKPVYRDTIKREQIIQIIDYARQHCHYMDYLILLFIRDLDTRNHEIIKTQWSWIQGDKVFFKDCKTGDTVGRLTPELKEALESWKTINPYKDSPFVFTVPSGPHKGKSLGDWGWYIRRLVNKVSLDVIGRRLNPQDLRASVITAEYTAYVNPKVIQLKARHRSEKTTMRYNHVDEEMVAAYLNQGTIFNTGHTEDIEPLLETKTEVSEQNTRDNPNIIRKVRKRGYINNFSASQDTLNQREEHDNSCVSFSVSFFVSTVSGALGQSFLVLSCISSQSNFHAPVLFHSIEAFFVCGGVNQTLLYSTFYHLPLFFYPTMSVLSCPRYLHPSHFFVQYEDCRVGERI